MEDADHGAVRIYIYRDTDGYCAPGHVATINVRMGLSALLSQARAGGDTLRLAIA